MPAYFESGMFVREPAWHGLGNVVDEYPGSWEEARKLAGLDWEVVEKPVYERVEDSDGEPVLDTDGRTIFEPIPDWKRMVRNDTGFTLGTRRDSWTLIPISEMGPIVESIIDQPDVQYETAGSLEGGRKVWALVRTGKDLMLPGETTPIRPYMAVLNGFDGDASCKTISTATRIVCANTWHAADMDATASGFAYSIRHTSNWRDQVEQAKLALAGSRKQFDKVCEGMTELLQVKVTKRQAEEFVRTYIPAPADGIISERVKNNIEADRDKIRQVLEREAEANAKVALTAYGLVQAAGEWCDHLRAYRNADTYLGRTLLKPEPRKLRAINIVREIVGAPKPRRTRAKATTASA
jgi:phage/plasmid-like protein (TIGR03299 family)